MLTNAAMSNNDDGNDDENGVAPLPPIGNLENRRLIGLVANLLTESQEHTRRLDGIYQELRALNSPAPMSIGSRLLEEERRHVGELGSRLTPLEELVKGAQP